MLQGAMSTATPFRQPQNNSSKGGNDFNMKAPKAPDRPLVPYMRYSRKMWAKVRADNPEAQLWDIGKLIGQMWRETSDTEKSVFQQEYDLEKVDYEKAMKTYHNSAPYQQYLAAKNRAKYNEKASRNRAEPGGVVIQPVDEDELNNELNSRRLAAVRFDRNHRLVADLFSPAIVTDTRTVVAQDRMNMLRKQATNLQTHQSKLEEELNQLEEKHQNRKRQIEKNAEDFAEQLAKVCAEKPQLDEERLAELVDEWTGKLAVAYEEYKIKQEEIDAKLAADREKIEKETPVLAELVMGDDNELVKSVDKQDDVVMKNDEAATEAKADDNGNGEMEHN